MRVLCYGSFATILKLCKLNSTTQKKLNGKILMSVNGDYDISDDDSAASNLYRCKRNLSEHVTDPATEADGEVVTEHFRDHVVPLLDPNKRKLVVLALQDLIANDNEIDGQTVVDKVSHLSKNSIASATSFSFADFLAGVFLYTATTVANRDGEDSIKEISAEYIDSFESRASAIALVEQAQDYNLEIGRELTPDISRLQASLSTNTSYDRRLLMTLMAEANGSCIGCGRNLGSSNNGQPVDYGEIVCLHAENSEEASYQNAVVLCRMCAAEIPSSSPEQISNLLETKLRLAQNAALLDSVSNISIERQVEDVLREIADLGNPAEHIDVEWDPVAVDEKISEYPLNITTRAFAASYYYLVQDILAQFEREKKLNSDMLATEIKLRYLAIARQASSQTDVYNALVDGLYNGNGQKHRSACDIIIACFVARCEVFDAITQ